MCFKLIYRSIVYKFTWFRQLSLTFKIFRQTAIFILFDINALNVTFLPLLEYAQCLSCNFIGFGCEAMTSKDRQAWCWACTLHTHTHRKIDFFSPRWDKWCSLMDIERPTNWQINDSWLSGIVEDCDLCRQAGSQSKAVLWNNTFLQNVFFSLCLFPFPS